MVLEVVLYSKQQVMHFAINAVVQKRWPVIVSNALPSGESTPLFVESLLALVRVVAASGVTLY
jgi:hypothetical protein